MKLLSKIILNSAISLTVIIAAWIAYTYYATANRIYRETDEYLAIWATRLTDRIDRGLFLDSSITSIDINSNYRIERVSDEYGEKNTEMNFSENIIYMDDVRNEQYVRQVEFTHRFADGKWYEITLYSPSFDKDSFSGILFQSALVLGGLLIITIILIISLIVYSGMKPLYSLIEWLKHHKLGEPISLERDQEGIEEFRQIRNCVIQSALRSNEAYNNQKLFISNASHEIQTPIAVCRNAIEMVACDPDLTENQIKYLAKADERLGYISKLNRTLLFLSKIDNNQYEDTQIVSFGKIAQEALTDVSEINAHKNISCNIAIDSDFEIRINKELAQSLTLNLVKNAFFHNCNGGQILIRISCKRIEIWNTAVAGPLDKDKIFKRFYKGSSSGETSCGLGLSIAESICHKYKLSLRYEFAHEMHCFSINRIKI